MSMDDFVLGKILGKGAFGSVLLVTRKTDNKVYAMKRVNIGKLNKKEKESSLNEIRILASLSHQNIIGYKEAFFDESTNTLNIVMEFAEEGDLEKKIKNNLKKRLNFEEETIWKWIIQLLQGIKYLHDNKIMHRDLKCANIFLMKNGLVKLGDLNVSKFAKLGMASTQTGTPYYCSPEIWKEKSYDYKSDIWSLGCIIYEICSLKPPFRGTSIKELRNNVLNGHYLPIPSIYSRELSILISKMLVIDPHKRASANELLKDEIVLNKIKYLNKIFNKDIKNSYNQEKANLIKTIRLPLNIKEINSKLPKKRYNPEEEMMKNDEYETMKQTFFQNLKEQKVKNIKNNSKNKVSIESKISNKNNNDNVKLNNYNRENRKKSHNKKIKKQNSDLKIRRNESKLNKKINNSNNSIENKKNGEYLFNKNFNYQYEQALNNNHKLRKFHSKINNYEEGEMKIDNNKYSQSPERKNHLINNFFNDENKKNIKKEKSEKNNLIMNNINNKNFIKLDKKDFPISPYNFILNENNEHYINKKNRYKNLFNDESDYSDNNHNKQFSENIKHSNHPQSALNREKKLNLKFNERNYNKIKNHRSRPTTSNPSNNRLDRRNNAKLIYQNKNNIKKINNLYDKYKNKNKKEQKPNLYGFKYVPQKRKVYNIAYNKVNYNDYCKKNNIDKNRNYHYYRENGYYNYRNAMKKYGNFVKNKNMAHIKYENELQNQNKFNNYLRNEFKGGGGAGYAARIRMQKYNK